jgi:hypothetical protein
MTAVLNIIYKLSAATDIIIGPSLAKGIETVINVFTFVFSRGAPHLSGLK